MNLREAVDGHEWYKEYEEKKHAELDWIRRTIDNLVPIY